MRAGEIAEAYPVVNVDTPALEAAWELAKARLPGLVVTGANDRPKAVLPASEVLAAMVPDYIKRDPSLAGVMGEKGAAKVMERLRKMSVADLLPDPPAELPVLKVDDTVLELAAVMARLHSPLCAVVDGSTIVGVVTASHLLELVCESLS